MLLSKEKNVLLRHGVHVSAVLGVFALIYRHTFYWLIQRWSSPDSYYSHGFLVLPIVIFLVWRKMVSVPGTGVPGTGREGGPRAETEAGSRGIGWFLVGIGFLVHIFSLWAGVYFVSGFSMIPVLFGLVLLCYGKQITRELVFPLLFMVSMIPLPLVTVVRLSFLLKMWSTSWAVSWVHAVGIQAIQDGSFIRLKDALLLVGDICSGMRSMIALGSLGALFAYFFQASMWRRLVLFLLAFPIALMVNTARIAFLCVVADVYGQKWVEGIVHDASGIFIFACSFILLGLFREVLTP